MRCKFIAHSAGRSKEVEIVICSRCGQKAVTPTGRRKELKRDCEAPPTLMDKAENLGKALGRWAISGFVTVSRKEFNRRGEICQACPIYDHSNESCGKCGCTVGGKERLIDKRRMKSETCPEGKW